MSTLRHLFLLIGFAGVLRAQSAHWESIGGSLPVGQVTNLQLIFENCEPKDTPAPPQVSGLSLEFSGQSSSVSWINGDYSRSVTYNYAALLTRHQQAEIPAFDVATSKGRVRVPAIRFQPADATVGGSGQTLENTASSAIAPSSTSVWAGEVFDLSYRIDASRSYSPDFGRGGFDWNSAPLLTEDWSQPENIAIDRGGEPRVGLVYKTRATIRNPGTYQFHPVTQLVNLAVGVTGFGFFQQRQYQQFAVTSNQPTIEVRPLPPAPQGFNGAVGDFKLSSKVVPLRAAAGEPITWTIELSGTGNWPDFPGLPPREVSKAFQVVQPKPKRTPAPGKLFTNTLTEDVVLVPTSPGIYTLEPFTFVYFDPSSGSYRSLTTPLTVVTVTPASASPGQTGTPTGSAARPATAPSSPEAPSGIPRDLLAGNARASEPWDGAELAGILIAPLLLLGCLWFGLALRRARTGDPSLQRRIARERLRETLGRLRKAPAGDRRSRTHLLLAWQRDAAVLWDIDHAAPGARQIEAIDGAEHPEGRTWIGLWEEADRALYARGGELPGDWTQRAEAALESKRLPGFSPRRALLAQNLLPFLLGMVVFLAGGTAARAGSYAEGAYRRGDFPAAEAGWRSDLKREPADWRARYDLSLALAQEDRWDEAAAQATAAFVQHPGDPSVRWQLALACDKAGFTPEGLGDFLAPDAYVALARLASPAAWQRALALSCAIAAAGLGLLLLLGYGALRGRWVPAVAIALLIAAFFGSAGSVLGARAYGVAGDSRAVIVWRSGTLRSIPTEVEAGQRTAPLSAGTIGVADRDFLGWIRLSFANGESGWIRKEEAVGLWR